MLTVALSVLALLQASAGGPADADTRAWWQRTTVLSADSMEGRDAGSRGYEHAARHVARWLAAAGVKPLGDGGSWYQWVPMEEVAVTHARLDVEGRPLRFLHDVTLRRADGAGDAGGRARLSRLLRGRRAGRRARKAGDLPRCAAARAADRRATARGAAAGGGGRDDRHRRPGLHGGAAALAGGVRAQRHPGRRPHRRDAGVARRPGSSRSRCAPGRSARCSPGVGKTPTRSSPQAALDGRSPPSTCATACARRSPPRGGRCARRTSSGSCRGPTRRRPTRRSSSPRTSTATATGRR